MNRLEGDFYFSGAVTGRSITPSDSSVTNAKVAADADIDATKLGHQYKIVRDLCDHATAAAVKRIIVDYVYGSSGTIVSGGVVASVACVGDATITFDIKKNGSSILSATISLTSATAANTLKEPAGFSSTTVAAGDVISFEITAVNAGTGTLPKGVAGVLILREKAQ